MCARLWGRVRMRRRFVWLAVTCVVLVAGSLGYVMTGVGLYQRYHAAYANYQFAETGPCGALVAWSPPRVLYTGLYVNQPQLLTLRYRAPSPERLRITVSIPQFTEEQTIEVVASAAFQERQFKPPVLEGNAMDALVNAGQRAAQIHLRVQSGGQALCETTAQVVLESRQVMHWYDRATGTNYAPYLAGWVTPHARSIDTLLGRAASWMSAHPASYPGTTSFVGYGGSAPDVVNQINALFDTLESVYQLRYASDNALYSQDATQRIKLPGDILGTPDPIGMCVETTAILASAAEALGMRPYFVIVPGHTFLGVALGPQSSAPIEYWETSDLNGGVLGRQANAFGKDEYAKYQAQGQILQVVDVMLERGQGIEPIE